MHEYWNPMVPELQVSDFEQSLHFYIDVLGFKARFSRKDPAFAFLELGMVQLMLEEIHPDAWLTDTLQAPYGRGVNFQIELPDTSAVLDSLLMHKVALFREQKESWYKTAETIESGQKEFLVQDPDGYLLRFVQDIGERPSP